jgi:peroxiredoxin Q/BCP
MAQLRQNYEKFVAEDTVIVVVGPENASAFQAFFEKNQLPFLGLPDPEHSVLKLYGQQIKLFKFGRMPAQLLIDKNGIVKFVHYGHDMTDIPKPNDMLELIETLNNPVLN